MSRTRTRTRRLALTDLENRLAPAAQLTASFDYADRVLRIEGTDGPDVMRIVNNAGQVRVAGLSIRSTNSGPVWTNVGSIAATDIGYIDVRALGGNDLVTVVEQNIGPALAVPMSVHGQQGHDTLNGGSAADGLYGGTGNDVINGNGGADHIEGGYSVDVVSPQAAQLDREFGFYGSDAYAYENWGGRGEKWIWSSTPDWGYFILPNGELYRMDLTYQPAGVDVPALVDESKEWAGSDGRDYAASGTLIATLDPSYHQNLFKLANAADLSGPPLAQDPLGPLAAQLDRDLGLTVEGEENLYDGQMERWLMDGRLTWDEAMERPDAWYYILPNGELYRWDGNWDVLGGTLVATLNPSYYEQPTRLTDAQYLFGNPTGTPIAAWYPGEGNAADAAGGNNGTTVNGVSFAPGRIGQAFQFDGVDDFVEIPDSAQLTPASITLEAWVMPDTVTGMRNILTKYHSSQPDNKSWALLSIDGRLRLGVYGAGNIARAIDTNSPVLTAGVWQHVVGTFDVATQAIRIYVDGVEMPSSFVPGGHDATINPIGDSNSPVRIGSIVNSSGAMVGFWDGLIDEATVYDGALSAADVLALFRNGKSTLPTSDAGDNDSLTGGAGNDTAIGGDGADSLAGGFDNDRLVGGNDSDTLSGNQGDDELVGCHYGFAGEVGNPNDSIWGGAGNDSLYGGDGADVMQGHNGNDYFRGDGGNDILYGGFADLISETGFANDTMEGGDGSDELYGGVGADVLIGQNDNDYLDGGRGADSLIGCFLGWAGETGNPNDTLYGGDGNDALYGGDGADRMAGQSHDDFLWGDGGNDAMYGDQSSIFVAGIDGTDTIHGGEGDDTLDGSGGADQLIGGNGNDSLNGGSGTDTLTGDSGADTLMGEAGADDLDGGIRGFDSEIGFANDSLDGGTGGDFMWGGEGSDTMIGGVGQDTLNGEAGRDWLDGGLPGTQSEGSLGNRDVLDGGTGDDTLWGGEGGDTLIGGVDGDTLNGESGSDWLDGGLPGTASEGDHGADQLDGGSGSDTMWGGEGDDTLRGLTGNDSMFGETGKDVLYGGAGADRLDGGFGQDGLFGGTQDPRDDLFGGPDADRILSADDNDLDRAPEDALLHFKGDGTVNFMDWEIELLDQGFAWLHAVRGNPALLKLQDGRMITFERVVQLESAKTMASNNNDGKIMIADWCFQAGVPADATVVHELGHNWDGFDDEDGGMEDFIEDEWLPLSGWEPDGIGASGKEESMDGDWLYNFDAVFQRASDPVNEQYGTNNPKDDWCTFWEAYYVGEAYANPFDPAHTSVRNNYFYTDRDAKFDVVERFFVGNI